jgi:hypothetical protein
VQSSIIAHAHILSLAQGQGANINFFGARFLLDDHRLSMMAGDYDGANFCQVITIGEFSYSTNGHWLTHYIS